MYFFDRVCETSTTTGTGNLTLAGAVAGFQTFNNSGAAGGQDFHYLIEAVDATGVPNGDWEVGVGTCPTTTTLRRIQVRASSNSGSAVNFAAGTKRVHLVASAYQLRWQGATAYMSADATAQNLTISTAITWAGTNPDTDALIGSGLWAVGNPTRLTMPASGYDQTTANLYAQVSLANVTAPDWAEVKIRLNGVAGTIIGRQTHAISTAAPALQVRSYAPITLGFSDYVELMVQVGTDTSVDIKSADTYLTLEMVQ